MALITCPDCTTEISDAAVACPKCARPMAAKKAVDAAGKGGMSLPTAVGIGMIGLGVYMFFGQNSVFGIVLGGFGFVGVILLSKKSSA